MEGNSFWLIYIQDTQLVVSLISYQNNQYRLVSTGPFKDWDINSESSFLSAVDESLSAASLNTNLSEQKEPTTAAFVLPPFWVDNDGKISSPKLKLIKVLCKSLNLKPSGFLSEDEAIIEETNQKDDFPSSFILLHINDQDFYLSLVYLGNIKERIRKSLNGPFTAQLLESTLLELNSEAALPPQIIVFGKQADQHLKQIKSFPWVGKKDVETFLHIPEVKLYQDSDILSIFSKVITSQIQPSLASNQDKLKKKDDSKDQTELVEEEVKEFSLQEADPGDLGFSSTFKEVEKNETTKTEQPKTELLPVIDNFPLNESQNLVNQNSEDQPSQENKTKKINFNFVKKIRLLRPKFRKNSFKNLFWIILIALPFLFFLILLFSQAKITLFMIPFEFKKEILVTLMVDGQIDDLSKSIIPVNKEIFEIKESTTIQTTGQLTTGERAKGEIVIYNKSSQAQSLDSTNVLVDSLGKKFELVTDVSIASSSSNLDEGVITLGQTKTGVIASSIGSEFNISKDTQLKFEDISDSVLIAKVNQDLIGGSKEQVSAVGSQDKENIEDKLDQKINQSIEDKSNNDLQSLSGILKETIKINKDKIELSREVGEKAEELSADIKASVSIFTLDNSVKEKIINQFLSDQENFNNIIIDLNRFDFDFTAKKVESQRATGSLIIKGTAIPSINFDQLKKSLTLKTGKKASQFIKDNIKRAFNSHIDINSPIDILPFRPNNISIEVKTETL
jgi:hypothetical protein